MNSNDSEHKSGKTGMLESLGGRGAQGKKATQSKPFSIGSTTTQRKGPSYYKDLYEFDPVSELEEFQLPFMVDNKNAKKQQSKISSGVINSTQLPPIQQQEGDEYGDEMGEPIQEEEELEGIEEKFQGMDVDSIDMDAFKAIIDNNEDAHKKQIMEVRTANFIRKGTYIHQVLHQIQTGEQAISFFAKHGNATPIKFLNANRRPVGPDEFRPYDLNVVHDKKKLAGEYFTISAQGVVHICPDKPKEGRRLTKNDMIPTEFLSLSEWMQQSTLFNVLTSMKFFKLYVHTKVFNLWKGNVRFKMYQRTRESLSRSLIFSRPAFMPTYFSINSTLVDMQTKTTFRASNMQKNQDIDDYLKDQRQDRELVKAHYSEMVDDIIKKLEDLVKQVNESRSLREEEDLEHTKMGQQAKNKSMVLQKKEDELKRRVMRLARINHQALGTFIRLTDYMILESLVKINQNSTDLILNEMAREGKEKKCFIQTFVDFNDTGVFFNPAVGDVTEKFTKELDQMLGVTAEFTRVTQHSNFSQYVQGLISDPPQFREIVDGSEPYAVSKEAITIRIAADFEALAKQAEKIKNCRPVHTFANEFVFEEWKAENTELDVIKKMLQNLAQWEDMVGSIVAQHYQGLFTSISRKLKDTLAKKVDQERRNVKKHLQNLADEKCDEMKKKLRKLNAKLGDEKESLEQYVGFTTNLALTEQEKTNLENDKKKLEEMAIVMRKNKIKDEGTSYQTNLVADIDKLDRNINELANSIANQRKGVEEEKQNMLMQLEQRIQENRESQQTVIQRLQNEILLKADTPEITALAELKKINTEASKLSNKADDYKSYEETLGIPPTSVPEIEEFKKKFEVRNKLWSNRKTLEEDRQGWYNNVFVEQDVEQFQQKIKKYHQESIQIKSALPRDTKDEVLEAYKYQVDAVKGIQDLYVALANKNMLPRHWAKIFKLLNNESGAAPPNMRSFTFQQLLDEGLADHKEKVEETSAQATGEATITATIEEIKKIWDELCFVVMNYRDTKDRFLITEIDDIITQLEDHQMSVQTMMGNRYVNEPSIKALVEEWEKRLSYISDVIEEWLAFQRQWMYLENIFNAEDIQKQLPQETKSFQGVDKFWRDKMIQTKKQPLILDAVCASEGLLIRLRKMNGTLEEIQRCLENYLGTKRAAFPRFFFLSNDELLEILSQTRNAHAVQPHLRKCFDGIAKIEFTKGKNSKEILGMWSAEQEYVKFSESVFAEGNVEFWLLNIEKMMVKTLYDITKQANTEYPEDGTQRDEWLFNYPAQNVLTVDLIQWTKGVCDAIAKIKGGKDKRALEGFLEFSNQQIDAMVALTQKNLNRLERTAIGALIVIDVHAREVVDKMIKSRVENENDFEWTKQLRYYWEMEKDGEELDDCVVRQTNTNFTYGYEYLGNGPRLVITPLTDQCYMTLTGALHLNYGGNPQGPAGTGKTETTKDLAKALAINCVVFNCSDGLDVIMMARFFSGLAQSGAWSCFDEFNRIGIEVLSVIAQQILTIQSAVRAKLKEFEFNDKLMPLNLRFGVFITMNPGYAGRTELPDNLKALFRPVSMMIPDYRLIAQIILFSEGFKSAGPLAQKMVRLYSLSSEQLSKQSHYDFGMRAVKSVLVMAGTLKRKNVDLDEDIVLIRAMRDSNIPKFLEHDVPLFEGIISDLFPGLEVPNIDYGKLELAIRNQLRLRKFQTPEKYVRKIIQLLETMLVRHGVMIVGSTGTGKTTCSKTLASALRQLHQDGEEDPWYKDVTINTLNPKAITMGELYGETDINTNEWTEGIVSKLVKDAVNDADDPKKKENKNWINFDGPVDALWIENMNTVLDDNKTLCLPNGQRIKLVETQTMMFEVQDLKVASPATVSRCGMVYLEPVHLGWEPLLTTWQEQNEEVIPEKFMEMIVNGVRTLFEKGLETVTKQCKQVIQAENVNLLASCLKLISALIINEEIGDLHKTNIFQPERMIQTYVVFSMIWSLGANIHDDSRKNFCRAFVDYVAQVFPDLTLESDVYDMGLDRKMHRFEAWDDQLKPYNYDKDQSFFEILVPTSDTTKYQFILKTLTGAGANVLITGETGVGKSVITKDFLMNPPNESIVSSFVNFSGKTTTKNLQDAFEGNLDAKRRDLLGPAAGKQMVFFIDDVNMPQLDTYFSQPPVELLRQTIDQGGFYDTKKLFFKKVQATKFVCACAPPSGGRNPVTPRLFRHFNMFWVPDLSKKSMETIFTNILKGFLDPTGQDIAMFATHIIKGSVDIYNYTIKSFLPTPTKCHYTFNLRDLSKVVQGMLEMSTDDIADKDVLVQLWVHETFRVFRDRLVSDSDRDKFNKQVHKVMDQYLQIEWPLEDYKDLLFGDIERGDGSYFKLSGMDTLIKELDLKLDAYNAENSSQMNLVFFSDCVAHLSRIARVLRQQRGNALLVGVGGSGRRSMATLGAYINQMVTRSIEIDKKYGEAQFHEDIRSYLRIAGLEDQKLVFLFSDSQIVKESFLEDINNLLNSGEVPNLFQADERQFILDEIRPIAREQKRPESQDALFSFFVQRCRENLHIVLAFSPVGEQFRNRCRQFPSIINCCTIDWYTQWPRDALYSVAERFYKEQQTILGIEEYIDQLCNLSVEIHSSVGEYSDLFYDELRRKVYTTPTSYLDLIKTYTEMLKHQRNIVPMMINRYQQGLTRLAETDVIVSDLKQNLTKLRPEIDKKAEETRLLVIEVETKQVEAAETERVTAIDEAEAQKKFDEVSEMRAECQSKLDEAMPIYNKAMKALDTLEKKDIVEMKSYNQPPEEVGVVIAGVCLLKDKKETWAEGKQIMSNPGEFISSLQNYDKDNIKEAKLKKLKKYIDDERMDPDRVGKKSTAAKSVCLFVHAIYNYATVLKIINPKRVALAQAEAELKIVDQNLKAKQATLQAVRDEIDDLQAKQQASQRMAEELNQKKEQVELQLGRAEKLVLGLASESERWKVKVKDLEVDLINLVGNMILAAGYISYVGPFTSKYRTDLMNKWMASSRKKGIPFNPSFTIEGTLGDPIQIRQWGICGLPADALSVENGIITSNAKRWPLLIDPQSQANRWLKNLEKDNGLQVTKLSNEKFLKLIETAIRMGQPVLLENIDETLDPSLEPILSKSITKNSGQLEIKVGDKIVPYDPNFKLYITTKLSNPHYLPEICIKVALVNFTVTPEGLEDQLLVEVVKNEQPELEQKKSETVIQLSEFKRQLKDIEDKILKLVSEAGEEILENEELIITLDQSKQTSSAIGERMEEAEKTSIQINESRELYRSVARRGSVLYFVIADLALVDPMYQYSLEFFVKLFRRRLELSEQSEVLDERLEILILDQTEAFYKAICRGLFEKDKLLYSFLNATSIMRRAGSISNDEWNVFLRGSPTDFSKTEKTTDLLSDQQFWRILGLEESHANFKDLSLSFKDKGDEVTWIEIMTSEEPSQIQLPPLFEERLTPFQKLMLIKSLRDEKTVQASKNFVKKELGEKYIISPAFSLEDAFKDTVNTAPIIFILSPGADPIAYLFQLAKAKGMDQKLKALSLGQGQGKIAEKLIDNARRTGEWVCLQNCHLSASWMPELERLQETQNELEMHPDYRLWLTSMPSKDFPIPVLQSGIKITNEPPKGLRQNMSRTLDEIKDEDYEDCVKPKEFKKLTFALAFFHAAILERRKYGALGWNISYEWMNSDINISQMQVKMFLNEQPDVPYKALNYLVADVNYGGRVTDPKDKILISSMLHKYFTPEIMNDSYRLSRLDGYYAPPEGPLQDVKDYVNSLPLDDEPEVFGLHSNANIVYEQNTVARFMDTVLLIQPRLAGSGDAKTPEEICFDLAKDIEGRLPKQIDLSRKSDISFAMTNKGILNSMAVFLNQEVDRFNSLLGVIKKSLKLLQQAIQGTVVMSMELESMFKSFLDNKVPDNWVKAAYPCLKPLASWEEDMIKRIEFISDWTYFGPPNSFWLPAFFFPQGFMTAALQSYSRQTETAIDTLKYRTNITGCIDPKEAKPVETGVQVNGLFLQGAKWNADKKHIDDSDPKISIINFPIIWLEPIPVKERIDDKTFYCPMYKTSVRAGELLTTGHSTNFVMDVQVPSEVPQDYWIRRGAALLCMTDD